MARRAKTSSSGEGVSPRSNRTRCRPRACRSRTRIKSIYTANGFRTVSGEGGFPFGLEKYGKVFFVAWRYKHRAALGEPADTLKDLAVREGVSLRFAQHIWTVMNSPSIGYPSSE